MSLPILEILSGISGLLDRFAPNKTEQERQKAAREILELTMAKDLAQGQLEINKVEAASDNLFVSGWRPMVGWIGAIALAWQYIVLPIVTFIAAAFGAHLPPLPQLASPDVMNLVFALLGLGAYRTYEKVKR